MSSGERLPNTIRLSPDTLVEHEREFDELSRLIGRIYECALDPAQWDDTLTEIVSALAPPGWEVMFLVWETTRPPACRFVGATSLSHIARNVYQSTFAGRHAWSRPISSQPMGKVIDTDELMPRSTMMETDFYRNFLSAWNLQLAVAVNLDRRDGETLGLVMPGPPDQPLEGLKRGLRLLAPHLQRAVRISTVLGEANLRAGAAEEALNRAPVAVATLDANLRVLNANAKMAELADKGWMRLSDGPFRLTDRAAQQRLIDLAAKPAPASAAFSTALAEGTELPVLAARLTPQVAKTLAGSIEGAAMVISVGVGPQGPLLDIAPLAAWWGLTPAEARLASGLAAGDSLQDYALRKAVSLNAVRFLLKGIFRKTGATSQAQLIAQVRALPTG